jgi:hypothetical protein
VGRFRNTVLKFEELGYIGKIIITQPKYIPSKIHLSSTLSILYKVTAMNSMGDVTFGAYPLPHVNIYEI